MINKNNTVLIYGCYGYTGKLIVDLASKQHLSFELGGRDAKKVNEMAKAYNVKAHVFSSDEPKLAELISPFSAVLNCAGPFFRTANSFMQACLSTGTHYLDITGEYQVFELGASMNKLAQDAQVMILPGVGFDVVPSDCLAMYLKSKLPNAESLELTLMTKGGRLSHGTAITIAENLGQKTLIRRNGTLTPVSNGQINKTISWLGKNIAATAISWGDISTAFFSTQIPNITVYNALPPSVIKSMKFSNYIGFVLRSRFVKNYLISKIKQKPAGPSEEERKTAKTFIHGEVKNSKGQQYTAYVELPEGYALTASTAVTICKKVLAGEFSAGFQTPSTAYGQDFILSIEDTKRVDL
jgi:short subunit dehydrogenase-like uncharacterized protein